MTSACFIPPSLYALRRTAANLGCRNSTSYTMAEFLVMYPQFSKLPCSASSGVVAPVIPQQVLQMFIDIAYDTVSECQYGTAWKYAIGLYVAHLTTLYAQSYSPDGSTSAAEAAQSGEQLGNVKSASLGDASISYDNTSLDNATEKWGTLNATTYGQQFANLARLIGIVGSFIG